MKGVYAALLLALLGFLYFAGSSHGHGNHRVFVRAEVVDAASGKPVRDAHVFVVQREIDEESYEFDRRQALRYSGDPEERALLDGDVLVTPLAISAGRTGADGRTEVWASRYHTVYTYFFFFSHREDGRLPKQLIVEHPGYDRIVRPIDPGTPLRTTGSDWKSRIDLGTIELEPR